MCRFTAIDIGTSLIGANPVALVDDDTRRGSSQNDAQVGHLVGQNLDLQERRHRSVGRGVRHETTRLLMIGTPTLSPVPATTTEVDDLELALIIEVDGPHVFRRNESVMNGQALLDTHRDGSGWKTDQLFALTIRSAAGLRAAQAPNGDLAIAFVHDNSTYPAPVAPGSYRRSRRAAATTSMSRGRTATRLRSRVAAA